MNCNLTKSHFFQASVLQGIPAALVRTVNHLYIYAIHPYEIRLLSRMMGLPNIFQVKNSQMPKRILVADDSAVIRKQIRTILESETDIEICAEATDGLEAVRKAHECQPDLAVIDFQMPVMNGLEATRAIKKQLPTVPVLLFTVYKSPELERESKRAGADAVLSKTEGSSRLSQVVHFLLRGD